MSAAVAREARTRAVNLFDQADLEDALAADELEPGVAEDRLARASEARRAALLLLFAALDAAMAP